MQTHTARTLDDIQHVKEFEDKTWDHARRFLAAAATNPFADHLRWTEEDGRLVACVQVFLHQYPIGCARVGMCLPEYPFVHPDLRGEGRFKRLMADLFAWLVEAGYPLVYDHGRKGLYTGIGFAPCYHHCMVLMRVPDARRVQAAPRAERASARDIDDNEDLFRRPFPLGRGLQCTDERYRPDPESVRLVRGCGPEEVRGFVVVQLGRIHPRVEPGDAATIMAAWAADTETAAALLRAVAEEAHAAGLAWLRINCRRTDPLARVAVLAGGELRWNAARERDCTDDGEDVDAFYVTDLRLALEQLLPELEARLAQTSPFTPAALRLRMDGEDVALGLGAKPSILREAPADAPCVHLPRKAMTRAIMGYATPTELCLIHEGVAIPDECRDLVDVLLPALEPHLIHEGLAFAESQDLGLVP